MKFLMATFLIIAILFMLVFMFIGIWLFIVAIKSHKQLRYQNYILEKICQKINILSEKMNLNETQNDNLDYFNNDLISDESNENSVNDNTVDNVFDSNN